MAKATVKGIRIRGLQTMVPEGQEDNLYLPLLSQAERSALIDHTGIRFRRIAPRDHSVSFYFQAAVGRLLDKLGWERDSVDVLICVTQSPDQPLPSVSCGLHGSLGLAPAAICFDINSGCSGFVYGLYTLSSLLSGLAKNGARAVLCCGDLSSRFVDPFDKAVKPVFSDAVSAIALEVDENRNETTGFFHLQTDGKGFDAIKVTPPDLYMRMQGIDVFNFSMKYVPANVHELFSWSGFSFDSIDLAVFHQANKLINESIRKKIGLSAEKVPYSLYDYGNTGSATIPLTLGLNYNPDMALSGKVLISGFGVGFSIASAILDFRPDVFGAPEAL
jgi:3-oxoacyl-[acyl-carrier-protein] synthase-3